ncbi:MAG TPA: hypothetical protein VFR81_01730 [Longimicrobium sp.]|nr:hypothetical protein [Longimicrobium sp.]
MRRRATAPALRAATLWLLLLTAVPAAAQRATVPPRGSPERGAIMDALREAVRPSLRKPVIIEVSHLRVQGNHAFLIGIPRKPDGSAFDYSGTAYQEARDEGMFDDWIYALCIRAAGRWRCPDFGIGATDVGWLELIGKRGAPESIFPEHGDDHNHD